MITQNVVKILSISTANEYTVIDSLHFAEENFQLDANLHKAGLEVDSSFTNIPHIETINICIDNLYNSSKNPPNIPKHDFRNLLNIVNKSFFMFNNKYYNQVDGVAMES